MVLIKNRENMENMENNIKFVRNFSDHSLNKVFAGRQILGALAGESLELRIPAGPCSLLADKKTTFYVKMIGSGLHNGLFNVMIAADGSQKIGAAIKETIGFAP